MDTSCIENAFARYRKKSFWNPVLLKKMHLKGGIELGSAFVSEIKLLNESGSFLL